MSAVVECERPAFRAPSVLDALVAPDASAAVLASVLPSGDSVAALGVLDPMTLSPAGRVDALVAADRAIAWLTAVQQNLLTAIADEGAATQAAAPARRRGDPTGDWWAAEEVACALQIAPVTAQKRITTARALTYRFHSTLGALQAGVITAPKAWALVDETRNVDDATAVLVEHAVLDDAATQTAGQFRTAVARAVHTFDSRTRTEQHQAAADERTVRVTRKPHGMASIWALLAAEDATALMSYLNTQADTHAADDPRTADQRRADALANLTGTATSKGRNPSIQVTVALSTLLGCDDLPADLTGYGPITAAAARRIADDPTGTWRRLLTDPAGTLLDYGTRAYKPPNDLARHVIARDRHCCFPGCRRTAERCDLDHRVPFPAGPTNGDNLQALCRRHHRLKHEAGWTIDRLPDGHYRWTAPTGHTYTTHPPPYPTSQLSAYEIDQIPADYRLDLLDPDHPEQYQRAPAVPVVVPYDDPPPY